jgi:hypothetical protein
MAIQAFRKGYAPGPRTIHYGASVAGERAVAILEGRSRNSASDIQTPSAPSRNHLG